MTDREIALPRPQAPPTRLTIAAFAAVVVFAAAGAIGVRVMVAELPPFWAAALRFGLAGLLLLGIVAISGKSLPRGDRLVGTLLFGLFNFGLTYVFAYWALREVQAGTFQVLLAVVPLLTFLLAVGHGIERFRVLGLVGALIAGAGIVVIFREQTVLQVPALPLLAVVASAGCVAEGSVLAKRFPPGDPISANAVAMLLGAALLGALSLLTGEHIALPIATDTWLALGYLVVFGSIVLFVLMLYVLERWAASAASYSFLITPLATVSIAAGLVHEAIQPVFALGAAIVLFGVYVGAFYRPRRVG